MYDDFPGANEPGTGDAGGGCTASGAGGGRCPGSTSDIARFDTLHGGAAHGESEA